MLPLVRLHDLANLCITSITSITNQQVTLPPTMVHERNPIPPDLLDAYMRRDISSRKLAEATGYSAVYLRRTLKDLPESLNCLSTNSERNLSQCANSSSTRSDTSQSTKSSSKVTSLSQPLGASRKATMLPRTLPSDDWMNEWNDDTPSSSNSHDNIVDNMHMPRPVPKQYSSIEDVDLEHELANQLAEAVAHRDWMIANFESANPKDVTDAIKTCNTLISQIISKQQTVVNMKRMLVVENSVIETMKEFPQEVKDKFFDLLEQNMKG